MAVHEQKITIMQGIHLFLNKIIHIARDEKVNFKMVVKVKISLFRILNPHMTIIDGIVYALVKGSHFASAPVY